MPPPAQHSLQETSLISWDLTRHQTVTSHLDPQSQKEHCWWCFVLIFQFSWQNAIVCQLTFYSCIDNSVFIIVRYQATLVQPSSFSPGHCYLGQYPRSSTSVILRTFSAFPRKLLFSRPRYLWRGHVRLNTIMCSNGNIENLLPNLYKIGPGLVLTKRLLIWKNYLSLFLTFTKDLYGQHLVYMIYVLIISRQTFAFNTFLGKTLPC